MALEIERRFLLKTEAWRTQVETSISIEQGYMSVEKERAIRVRRVDDHAWLTIKGYVTDVSRLEFEYPIPVEDAKIMLETLCPFVLSKVRHHIHVAGFLFEIDEYTDKNQPLIVAEIELDGEDTPFPKPDWLGEEITSNGHYSNAYLSQHPYSTWTD